MPTKRFYLLVLPVKPSQLNTISTLSKGRIDFPDGGCFVHWFYEEYADIQSESVTIKAQSFVISSVTVTKSLKTVMLGWSAMETA